MRELVAEVEQAIISERGFGGVSSKRTKSKIIELDVYCDWLAIYTALRWVDEGTCLGDLEWEPSALLVFYIGEDRGREGGYRQSLL